MTTLAEALKDAKVVKAEDLVLGYVWHFYTSTGYGPEPCSVCGGKLLPGQRRGVREGEWRPFHADNCKVKDIDNCVMCGEDHFDGACIEMEDLL